MTYLSAHIAINFSGASSEQLLVSHRTQNASFVTRCDETGTTGEDRASQSHPGYTDATHLVIRKRSSVSSAATAASEELSSPDRLQQLLWRHRPPSDREQHDDIHDSDHTGQRGLKTAGPVPPLTTRLRRIIASELENSIETALINDLEDNKRCFAILTCCCWL